MRYNLGKINFNKITNNKMELLLTMILFKINNILNYSQWEINKEI